MRTAMVSSCVVRLVVHEDTTGPSNVTADFRRTAST